jgi:formamidopyrimidine-DNA glycosylase
VVRQKRKPNASPEKIDGKSQALLLSHRGEEECPWVNGEIRKAKAAGRTAYYCPVCQPEERYL